MCQVNIKECHRLNPSSHKYEISILLTVCRIFLWMLVLRIWLYIKTISPSWWFSLFSSPVCFTMYRYCKEKLDFDHSWEIKRLAMQVGGEGGEEYVRQIQTPIQLPFRRNFDDQDVIGFDFASDDLWLVERWRGFLSQSQSVWNKTKAIPDLILSTLNSHSTVPRY